MTLSLFDYAEAQALKPVEHFPLKEWWPFDLIPEIEGRLAIPVYDADTLQLREFLPQ